MIEELKGKLKYDEIINHINSRVRSYNESLHSRFEDFKKKMDGHKTSLEGNIKGYIGKIKENITELSSCVSELIESISKAIQTLETNKDNLSKFNDYETKQNQLIKVGTEFTSADGTHFKEIVNTHKQYKELLNESCFSEITDELTELKNQLDSIKKCSEKLTNELNDLSSNISNTDKIGEVENSLQTFKDKVNKLNGYMSHVKKLQEINGYITKMKEELEKVQDKVKDEAKDYITKLENVDITESGVREKIDQIEKKAELIIKRLEIAKSAIGFYKSLEAELEKLNNQNGVNLNEYDFTDYLTVKSKLSDVKNKLTTFKSNIDSTLNSTNQAIQNFEQKIKELTEQCPGIQERSSGQEDKLIPDELKKLVNQDDTSEITKITSFIDNSLEVIRVLEYILPRLEEYKKLSPKISEIGSEVSGINNLNDAITKLSNAVQKLKIVLQVQEDTKSLIGTFKDYHNFGFLGQYSDELQDSISIESQWTCY